MSMNIRVADYQPFGAQVYNMAQCSNVAVANHGE